MLHIVVSTLMVQTTSFSLRILHIKSVLYRPHVTRSFLCLVIVGIVQLLGSCKEILYLDQFNTKISSISSMFCCLILHRNHQH